MRNRVFCPKSQNLNPRLGPAPSSCLWTPCWFPCSNVPKRSPPSWRSATHEGGRWRLRLEWSAGPLKEATLFLDDGFNPVKADLTYATSPAKIGGIASWPLLWDSVRNLKADQLAPPPQSELTITDKSSSIHALKNGRPIKVQAQLIDIHRMGKML